MMEENTLERCCAPSIFSSFLQVVFGVGSALAQLTLMLNFHPGAEYFIIEIT